MENAKRLKRTNDVCDTNTELSDKFLKIEYALSEKLQKLKFEPPIQHVYNPLEYAKELHVIFIRKYYNSPDSKILFVGMNPGPWGMCQTGIPFGESQIVNEWFNVTGTVTHPQNEHPSRQVTGLECKRSEVSGKKFWGLIKKICVSPENFFRHCLVYNHCPLAFLTKSGKNVTPAEIKANNRKELIELCDEAFIDLVIELNITTVIGIGKFAEKRVQTALKTRNVNEVKVYSIPHPSPRSARYFVNWENVTTEKLKEFGIYQLLTENTR